MKRLSRVARHTDCWPWQLLLVPAYIGMVLAIAFLFLPSDASCEMYRLFGAEFRDALMICDNRYWFCSAAAALAAIYAIALTLYVGSKD